MKFEILSVINWDGDEWDVVYRYQGTTRCTKVHDKYHPNVREIIQHLQEMHHG